LGDNAAGKCYFFDCYHHYTNIVSMVFEHIEKLKRAFTDKYVVVDATRPELARFGHATGLVKTVNMNGRALVEFDQFDNTGWYDIELDFLKVVPKPEPKPAEAKKEPAAKAAPQKGSEKAAAPAATATKPAAAGGKPSTADILAAARAKKAAGEPAAKAARAAKPAAPKALGGKMSTADILAMARAKAGTAAAPPAAAPAAKPAKPVAKVEPEPAEEAEEPVAEAAPIVEPAKPAKKSSSGPKPTTVAEKIAYCRQVDTK
jgi:hypothetical protein